MTTGLGELRAGSTVAEYTVEGVAGRGGMGIVYLARQEHPHRRVALKVISPELASDPEYRARFEREVDVAASIEHPNVIPIYAGGEDHGVLYLAMRFIEGTDLRAWLEEHGPMSPRRAVGVVAQVGDALDAAHAAGLVHRDVKPGNVLLTERNARDQVYLTDFGLTKQSTSTAGLTRTGSWVGTVDYMAPEQIRAEHVDARADVYSLGCLLFELLSGQVPFERDSDVSKIFAHMSDPPPSLAGITPGDLGRFDEVVHRAMAKEADDRYPSAGDLGRAAVAVAERRAIDVGERSVAVGAAAPNRTQRADREASEPDSTQLARTELEGADPDGTRRAAAAADTPVLPTEAGDRLDAPRRRRFARPQTTEAVEANGAPIVDDRGARPTRAEQPAAPASEGGSRRTWLWVAVVGCALALAGVAAVLVFVVFGGSNYGSRLNSAMAPVVGANRQLSSQLAALSGSSQPSSALSAATAAQQATSTARGAVDALGSGGGLEARADDALTQENAYLSAVKATLQDPHAPGSSQLESLAGTVQDRFDSLSPPLADTGQSVGGASNLVAWAGAQVQAQGQQDSLQTFASDVDSLLQRSGSSFQEVNQLFQQMQNGTISVNDAESGLGDVISNRSALDGAAQTLSAPTDQANQVKQALVQAFDASLTDDQQIQSCLNQGVDTGIESLFQQCLSSTKSASDAATSAKQSFTSQYNQLRQQIGLPPSNTQF